MAMGNETTKKGKKANAPIYTISLAQIIKDKSVVVIGNAPIETDISSVVNDADIVFRFNHAYNMTELTGERVTHLVATPCSRFDEKIATTESGKKIVAQKPMLLTCKQYGTRTNDEKISPLFEKRAFIEESEPFDAMTTGTNFLVALGKVARCAKSISIYGLPYDIKGVSEYFHTDARHYSGWVNEMRYRERLIAKIAGKEEPDNAFVLPVVPLRSGSSCKDKNIRPFRGMPLCAWSIRQCNAVFGMCVVVTDSMQYVEEARNMGAKAVLMELDPRNISLSMKTMCELFDYKGIVGMRQATSPLMSDEGLRQYYGVADILAEDKEKKIVGMSMAKLPYKSSALFERSTGEDENGEPIQKITKLTKTSPTVPRQQIPELVRFFGGFTLFHSSAVVERGDIFAGCNAKFIYHSEQEALDIDKDEDFYK